MLKLEVKLDENKINREQRYSVASIYQTLEKVFNSYHLRKDSAPDGTIVMMVRMKMILSLKMFCIIIQKE